MLRQLSLVLLTTTLGACASSPRSETQSLVDDVLTGRSEPLKCAAAMYCLTNGSRIAGNRDANCTCDPPASLQGRPISR